MPIAHPAAFAKSFYGVFRFAVLVVCLPVMAEAGDASKASEMDWPHWRGPELNGVSREKGIVEKWSPKGENVLWKREDLGSRATPIVMNGKLYIMARHNADKPDAGEKVVCLDAATGETLWENSFNVFLSDAPATQVGWSAVTGDPTTGDVFAVGACGYLQCIDGNTGKTKWSHSLSEEYGMVSADDGHACIPILQGSLVIVHGVVTGWGDSADPCHRFVAFHKSNGQPVWFAGTRGGVSNPNYSSPIGAVINGQKTIVFGSGDGGVHAFHSNTGKELFSYNVSRGSINTTPLVVGNTVVCGHSEENADGKQNGALFALDGAKTGDITASGEKWNIKEAMVGKSSPIHVDGRIYACDDKGSLLIIDLESGKQIHTHELGGPVSSSPLYVDGKIFICTENGTWWTLKPTEAGVDVVHTASLDAGENYGSPIVAQGRLYVPTTKVLYCIGYKDAKPSADPRPEVAAINKKADNPAPVLLQIVPVESLLKPNQAQQFGVRFYNSDGEYVGIAKDAEFSIEGPGKINDKGYYQTPTTTTQHSAVYVTVKAKGLTARARIRLVPDLPWSFGFDDGQVPITWVGAGYHHTGLDFDFFSKLREADPRAADLYLQANSAFHSVSPKVATFDDSNPSLPNYTNMLTALGLDGADVQPKTLDDAKKLFDPALQKLVDEKFLASFAWSQLENGSPKLVLNRGERSEIGNGVIGRFRSIPTGTKSHGWMGPSSLKNYTIQADAIGLERNGKLPDIGMIGQRYVFDLQGASQQLQIRTAASQQQMIKTTPFEWKADTWYTMKMQAVVEGDKAVVSGKVWVRGEEEPAEWMVVAEDVSPNIVGSPGIFANAAGPVVFYDNFKITANTPTAAVVPGVVPGATGVLPAVPGAPVTPAATLPSTATPPAATPPAATPPATVPTTVKPPTAAPPAAKPPTAATAVKKPAPATPPPAVAP